MNKVVILEKRFKICETQMTNLKKFAKVEMFEGADICKNIDLCSNANIVVVNSIKLTNEFFENCKDLKLVIKWGVGVDNIDIISASSHGVIVCNCPHYGTLEVAEYGFMLTLLSLRKFLPLHKKTVLDGWVDVHSDFYGRSLRGLTIGVVGLGRIGKAYLKMLNGFGAKVIAYSKTSKLDTSDEGFARQLDSLDEVLSSADVISLHLELNSHTAQLIDREKLKLFKKNAVLINISRGALVNEGHVLSALKSGHLSCYAADVFTNEPLAKDSPLRNNEKVIISPHYAYLSEQSCARIDVETVKCIEGFVKGKKLVSVLNARLLKDNGFAQNSYPHGYLPYSLDSYTFF